MDADTFRAAAHSAIEEIIEYHKTISTLRVVSSVSPGYLRSLLPPSAPRVAEEWSEIQADMERVIRPGLTHWNHPGFMAYFPAPSTFPSILGELYSAAYSAPAFSWVCSPVITELETVVLDWLAKMMDLPPEFLSENEGGGVIQGSACEAILTVMTAARERLLRRRRKRFEGQQTEEQMNDLKGRLVALGSEQAHSSTQKGAMVAGTRYLSVPAGLETGFAMTGSALRTMLEYSDRVGLVPYFVTVTLGTTASCAVDEFVTIAEVIRDWPDVWVHVDAAYAGAALICEEHQYLAKTFRAFDSFDVNMHKWLLTNFDASCLFVQRRSDLTQALSITPSYLRNSYSDSGLVIDYRDLQIPLSRRFRSLKIWFVLRSYGIQGLQSHIRRTIGLGEYFYSLVFQRPDLFSILTGPAYALTLVTIVPRRAERWNWSACPTTRSHFAGATMDDDAYVREANQLTREVHDSVNKQGEVYLTSAVLSGIYAIRVACAGQSTDEHFVRRAFDILVEAAESARASRTWLAVDKAGVQTSAHTSRHQSRKR